MILYNSAVSGNCYKVRLLLHTSAFRTSAATSTSSTARTGPRSWRPQPGAARADARARRRPPARRVGRDPLVLRRRHAASFPTTATRARRCSSGCSSSSTTMSRRSRSRGSGSATRGCRARVRRDRLAERPRLATRALDAMERHLVRPSVARRRRDHARRHRAVRVHARGGRGRVRSSRYPRSARGSTVSPPSPATCRSTPEGYGS